MKGCLTFFIGILVGAILLVGLLVFVVPAPVPPAGPASAPATSGTPDVSILLRNDFLTRELQREATQADPPIPLSGITVQTASGNQSAHDLVVSGTLALPETGLTAPAQITVHPAVSGNQLTVQVVKMDVGGLPVPSAALQASEGSINRALNQELGKWVAGTSYQIQSVTTTPQGLVVNLIVKGSARA